MARCTIKIGHVRAGPSRAARSGPGAEGLASLALICGRGITTDNFSDAAGILVVGLYATEVKRDLLLALFVVILASE